MAPGFCTIDGHSCSVNTLASVKPICLSNLPSHDFVVMVLRRFDREWEKLTCRKIYLKTLN